MAKKLPLEAAADRCDMRAESRNDHDYVGVHRLLAALLYREVGRERATTIIQAISRMGGLDGMNGLDGHRSAHRALGVPDGWHEWSLPAAPDDAPTPDGQEGGEE